jgi:hypothetical protein
MSIKVGLFGPNNFGRKGHILPDIAGYIEEGKGSRVRMELNGVRAVFHRPHSAKETGKGALKSVRRFLSTAGVKYEI